MGSRNRFKNDRPSSDTTFKDGYNNQVSNYKTIQIVTGSATRKLSTEQKQNNTFYTVTRLSQDGDYFKKEVILFDNIDKVKAFNKLTNEQKGLGANGLGVTIATGSTDPNKPNFELTEKGQNIDFVKAKESTIKKESNNQIKQIVNNESLAVKKGVQEFSSKEANETKDDSIAAAEQQAILAQKNREGIGRKSYGNLFYPSFIKQSQQDKLKITILKQASRFRAPTTTEVNGKHPGTQGSSVSQLGKKAPRRVKPNKGVYARKDIKNNNTQEIDPKNVRASTLDNAKRPEFGKRTLGSITLPIPDGVTDQNKVSFGSGALNPFQVALANTALDTLLKGLGEGAKTAASTFENAAKDSDLKPAIANLITSSLIGVDNNELLARGRGTIINNNLELLFKGPTLRPFTFQFILSPRDDTEATQVAKIIRAFKQSSAVQRTPGGIFLAAPNTYRLQFLSGGGPHKFLPRMKECALTAVSVNYMPENSYMTYEDSSMVAYSVNVNFQELEPIFNDDYDKEDLEYIGGNPISAAGGPLSTEGLERAIADTSGIGF
jgi:hypothetical protein